MSEQPATDLRVLVGKDLIQLCIGRHQVIMRFHPDVSVSFETAVLVESPDGGPATWTPPPAAGAALLPFLDGKVESAATDGAGDLILAFEGGTVRIQRDASGYESYQIAGSGLEVVA